MLKRILITGLCSALSMTAFAAPKIVKCPDPNAISVTTNEDGKICWAIQNPENANTRLLYCLGRYPAEVAGNAVDTWVVVNSGWFGYDEPTSEINCEYPGKGGSTRGKVDFEVNGKCTKTGPTTFSCEMND